MNEPRCPKCNSILISKSYGKNSWKCSSCCIVFCSDLPPEIYENHEGKAISFNDILDFHQELKKEKITEN